jgi:hypothetical protein
MTANAQIYNLKILKSDTIQAVKEKCEKETKIPPESQNLVYKGRILSNEKLVSDYKIDNDHTIILVKKHIPSSSSSTENKQTSQNTNTIPILTLIIIIPIPILIILIIILVLIIIIIITIRIHLWD